VTTRTILADGQQSLFVPSSDWRPPTHLPSLRGVDVGLDTETRDNGLARGRGPGWVYRDGYIIGVSVAWDDSSQPGGVTSIYVPVRHPETENRDIGEVIVWVEDILRHCRVHFFNISYDMGWLFAEGCTVWPERSEDGAAMAFVADENHQEYSLDACCSRAGVPGKDETLLREAAAALGVQPLNGSVRHGLYRLPARYVGPYAAADAAASLTLCRRLQPTLEAEGTVGAYRTEMDLFPCTNAMRWRGIRVSTEAAERAQVTVRGMLRDTLDSIDTPWQRRPTLDDLRSPGRLAQIFDAEGVPYPRTPKTNEPSFQAKWLEQLAHPVGKKIRRARQLGDLDEKFLGTYILDYEHRGRIHAEIRQLRAVTHRFAYSDPPLQQTPSRDEILAPLVRNVFLPEDGEWWLAADLKQQEPRLCIHYSYLAQKDARKYGISMGDIDSTVHYYRTEADPDFHTLGASILGLTRKAAKDQNQAMTYRLGVEKLAVILNISEEDAGEIHSNYHRKIPYISGLARYAEAKAKDRGYVKMIDGARRHFPLWQPRRDREAGGYAYFAEAEKRWPGQVLERAFAYQAGNSLVQGSAARQVKRAMVGMWQAGHLPLLQMHDEIDGSVTSRKQCEEIGEILRTAVTLVVPVGVDLECGPTWGKAKKNYQEVFGDG
jgi:DNA polymerase I-like protein with 3'-5' exonuclease and polymerase domains